MFYRMPVVFCHVNGKKGVRFGRQMYGSLQGGGTLDPKTYKLLQQADWGDIYKKLIAFALWRAQNYDWHYGWGKDFALGQSAEDIAQKVIEKTLTGERKWDPEKGELLSWLKDQVKSIVDATAHSAAHRYETASLELMLEDGTLDVAEYRVIQAGSSAVSYGADPKEAIIQSEESERQAAELFEAMDGDPNLEEILLAVWDGCECKPQTLAALLSTSVSDINNRLKRIRRRIIKVKGGY